MGQILRLSVGPTVAAIRGFDAVVPVDFGIHSNAGHGFAAAWRTADG